MKNSVSKQRLSIITPIMILAIMLVFLLCTVDSFTARALERYSVSFASPSISFYEAEAVNKVYISTSSNNKAELDGATVTYTVNEGEYGKLFSSASEGVAKVVYDLGLDELYLEFYPVYADEYDTGKQFELTLDSVTPVSGNEYYVYSGSANALFTVKDKNPDGFVAITSEDKRVFENVGSLDIVIQCSPNFFGTTVTLEYSGNAVMGEDYTAPDEVFLPAGVTEKTVTINILDNHDKYALQKDVLINLASCSQGSEIAAIPNNTSIAILDDESKGVVGFLSDKDGVVECDGDYQLVIQRVGGTFGDLPFVLAMQTDATIGESYVADLSGEYMFSDGEASKTLRLKLREDEKYTGVHLFTFTLSNLDGGDTIFGIQSLTVSREDSFFPSDVSFRADEIDGQYAMLLHTKKNNEHNPVEVDTYSISVEKSLGGMVDLSYQIAMYTMSNNSTWVSSLLPGYEQGKTYSMHSDLLESGEIGVITVKKALLDDTLIGDHYIKIRFFNPNGDTTILGKKEYTLTIHVIDRGVNGKVKLAKSFISGSEMYIVTESTEVSTVQNSLGRLKVSQNDVVLATYELSFGATTTRHETIFPLVGDGYNAVEDGTDVTVKLEMDTAVIDGENSVIVNTQEGKGGIVGFFNGLGTDAMGYPLMGEEGQANLILTEGGSVSIKLKRAYSSTLAAISVPVYLKDSSVYFPNLYENSQPVGTVAFAAGELNGTLTVSIAEKDGKLLGDENVYLIIKPGTAYTVGGGNDGVWTRYPTNEPWPAGPISTYNFVRLSSRVGLTIHDADDYAKVGFEDSVLTADEGTSISVKLNRAVFGIDAKAEVYVKSTNLVNVPSFEELTVTSAGVSFAFTYEDNIWYDNSAPMTVEPTGGYERGYMVLAIKTKAGNPYVNNSGCIDGQETLTIYLNDNDMFGKVSLLPSNHFGDYAKQENGDYVLTVSENFLQPEKNRFTLQVEAEEYTKESRSKAYSAPLNFSYTIATLTEQGSHTLVSYTKTFNGRYEQFDIIYNLCESKDDQIFFITVFSDNGNVACNRPIKVIVNNTQPTINITMPASLEKSEQVGVAEFTLLRDYVGWGDLSFSLVGYQQIINSLSEAQVFVDGVITDGTFVWNSDKESVVVKIVWKDDKRVGENINLSLALSGENATFAGNTSLTVLEDELDGDFVFDARYADNTDNANPFVITQSEIFSEYSNNLSLNYPVMSIYFTANGSLHNISDSVAVNIVVEALNQSAATYLGVPINGEYSEYGFYSNHLDSPKLDIMLDDCVGAYLPQALFKVTIKGNSLNEELSQSAPIYIKYVQPTIAVKVPTALSIIKRLDEADFYFVKTASACDTANVTLSLPIEATEAGFRLDKSDFSIGYGDQSVAIKLYSPQTANSASNFDISYTVNGESLASPLTGDIHVNLLEVEQYIYSVSCTANSITEGEGIDVIISRSGSQTRGNVDYNISALDTRSQGNSGTLYFSIGETQKRIAVTTVDDRAYNQSKQIVCTLSNAFGGADQIRTATAIITVEDNDSPLANSEHYTTFNETFVQFETGDFDADGLFIDICGIMADGTVVFYENRGVFYSKITASAKADISNYYTVLTRFYKTNDGSEHTDLLLVYSDKVSAFRKSGDDYARIDFSIQPIEDTSLTMAVLNSYLYSSTGVRINYKYGVYLSVMNGKAFYLFDSEDLLPTQLVGTSWTEAQWGKTATYDDEYGITENMHVYDNKQTRISLKDGKISLFDAFDKGFLAQRLGWSENGKYVWAQRAIYDYRTYQAFAENVSKYRIVDLSNCGYDSLVYLADGKLMVWVNSKFKADISFAMAEYAVNDTDEYADITIEKRSGYGASTTIDFMTKASTAKVGTDFAYTSEQVVFEVGEFVKTVRVYLYDGGTLPKGSVSFFCLLSTEDSAISSTLDSAAVIIEDSDDSGQITIDQTFSLVEGEDNITLKITRPYYSKKDLTVDYTISDEYAVKYGTDFSAVQGKSGSLYFPPEATESFITFSAVDDDFFNAARSAYLSGRRFVVTLSNLRSDFDYTLYPNSAPTFINAECVVEIVDDESPLTPVDSESIGLDDNYSYQLGSGDSLYKIEETFDINKDGKKDSYDTSNGIKVVLDCESADGKEYVYSYAVLCEMYGVTLINPYVTYVPSLNLFVLCNGDKAHSIVWNGVAFVAGGVSFDTSVQAENLSGKWLSFGDFDGDKLLDAVNIISVSSLTSQSFVINYLLSSQNYVVKTSETKTISTFVSPAIRTMTVYDYTDDGRDDVFFEIIYIALNGGSRYIACMAVNHGEQSSFQYIVETENYSSQIKPIRINEEGGFGLFMLYQNSGNKHNMLYMFDGTQYLLAYKGEQAFGGFSQCDYQWDLYYDSSTNSTYAIGITPTAEGGTHREIYLVECGVTAVTVSAGSANEKDRNAEFVIFNPSGKADTITYALMDGRAIASVDYTVPTDCTVIFEEGQTIAYVRIPLINNRLYDGEKDFTLLLISSSCSQYLMVNSASVIIEDDETADLLQDDSSFRLINTSFEYTLPIDYTPKKIVAYENNNVISEFSDTNTLTFNFASVGYKKITLIGYSSRGYINFNREIIFNVIGSGELVFDVRIAEQAAADSEISVGFSVRWKDGLTYYPVNNATISFTDQFGLTEQKLQTAADGTVGYRFDTRGGDYGDYTLMFFMKSMWGNLDITKVVKLVNASGKITGYVMLPNGNIGAGGISVTLGQTGKTTDNNGYFELDAVSGNDYTIVINKDKENTFYEETSLTVTHSKAVSLLSVTLEESVDSALDLCITSFYDEYFDGTSKIFWNGDSYKDTSWVFYMPNSTNTTQSKHITAKANYFSTNIDIAEMTINYPSCLKTVNVTGQYMWMEKVPFFGTLRTKYSGTQYLGTLDSRTEILFSVDGITPEYFDSLEFVVCDKKGNTLRTLTNVDYSYLYEGSYQCESNEALGMVRMFREGAYLRPYSLDKFIKLTIFSGDVQEGELLYLRRVTSNDVIYYNTGVEFGRSLAEIVRDDLAGKFDEVSTKGLPSDFGYLEGSEFAIDLYSADTAMVKNADGTVSVYIGYATATKSLDIVPETLSTDNGSISFSRGKGSAEVSFDEKLALYMGGIFQMEFNEQKKVWEYRSGSAKFLGYSEQSTEVKISFELFKMVSVYVSVKVTESFASNINIDVASGALTLYGSFVMNNELRVAAGVNLTLIRGEIWGKCSGGTEMFFGTVEGSKMNLTFSGGMTAYILWAEYELEWFNKSFVYDQTYIPEPVEDAVETPLSEVKSFGDGYTVPISDGVLNGDANTVPALSTATIVPQTIISSTPTIAEYSGGKMLVYKQGVTKNGCSYSGLFFRLCLNGVWGAAKEVTKEVRNISEFSVCVFNGSPVIAYTHTTVEGDVASQMRMVEVTVAMYDKTRNEFRNTRLTEDTLPDSAPVVVADSHRLIVLYTKTYRSDYTAQTTLGDALFSERSLNYLMYSVFSNNSFSTPKVAVRGIYNTVDRSGVIIDNKLYYGAIADMDGNIRTENDTEVLGWIYDFNTDSFSESNNMSNNAVAETKLQLLVKNSKPLYLWLNKYGVNYSYDGVQDTLNTREEGNITYFKAVANGNNIVLAWTENQVNSENALANYVYFTLINTNGDVGIRKALIGTDGVIIDYSIMFDNQEVSAVYCMALRNAETGVGRYSVESVIVPFVESAGVSAMYTATGRWRAGATETIYCEITNYGDFELNNIRVVARENNQEGSIVDSPAIISQLAIGETKTIMFRLLIPEGLYGLFVTIDNAAGELSAEVENSKKVVLLGAATMLAADSERISDISYTLQTHSANLEEMSVVRIGEDTLKVISTIKNLGDATESGVLKIYADKNYTSTLLKTIEFTVGIDGTAEIAADLLLSELEEYSTNGMVTFVGHITITGATIPNYAQTTTAMLVAPQPAALYEVDFGQENVDVQAEIADNCLISLPTPIKENYAFDGWYLDEEFTIPVELPMQLTQNVRLYAKWIEQPTDSQATPWWVIVLSIIGGLLLISAGSLYLVKISKSKNKGSIMAMPEDCPSDNIKEEQTESLQKDEAEQADSTEEKEEQTDSVSTEKAEEQTNPVGEEEDNNEN